MNSVSSSHDGQGEQGGRASQAVLREHEEFPYRVEIWNYAPELLSTRSR
jgi:hypothetical protein